MNTPSTTLPPDLPMLVHREKEAMRKNWLQQAADDLTDLGYQEWKDQNYKTRTVSVRRVTVEEATAHVTTVSDELAVARVKGLNDQLTFGPPRVQEYYTLEESAHE